MKKSTAISILSLEQNNLYLKLRSARSKKQIHALLVSFSNTVLSVADSLYLPDGKANKEVLG